MMIIIIIIISISAFYIFCEKSREIVCVHPQNITLTPDPATLRNCSLSPLERHSNTAQRVSAQWTDLVFFEAAAFLSPATVFMAYYIYCTVQAKMARIPKEKVTKSRLGRGSNRAKQSCDDGFTAVTWHGFINSLVVLFTAAGLALVLSVCVQALTWMQVRANTEPQYKDGKKTKQKQAHQKVLCNNS